MGNTDSIQVPIFATDSPDYEIDFHAWSMEQAARLRLLRVPGLDIENIAEEIESLGRSDKRELLNRLTFAVMHLLKWRYQPERQGRSWIATIDEQRQAIEPLLGESPSLRSLLPRLLPKAYEMAVRKAERETGLPKPTFPPACQWTLEEVLAEDFLPKS